MKDALAATRSRAAAPSGQQSPLQLLFRTYDGRHRMCLACGMSKTQTQLLPQPQLQHHMPHKVEQTLKQLGSSQLQQNMDATTPLLGLNMMEFKCCQHCHQQAG
jgi:hypothetical protein